MGVQRRRLILDGLCCGVSRRMTKLSILKRRFAFCGGGDGGVKQVMEVNWRGNRDYLGLMRKGWLCWDLMRVCEWKVPVQEPFGVD